jgi:hypothetical protein
MQSKVAKEYVGTTRLPDTQMGRLGQVFDGRGLIDDGFHHTNSIG